MKDKYYLLSLGCPKNEVDAEAMSSILISDGYLFVQKAEEADFLIVNTCAFIESAKREAIEAILALADVKENQKQSGKKQYLIVTGCLSQRYAEEIYTSLPEVDAVLGTAEFHKIADCCAKLKVEGKKEWGKRPGGSTLIHLEKEHRPSSDQSFAWLKIAEGCSNACAFCAIPLIRGKLQSRPIEDIIRDAQQFAKRGFAEQIVIAQDTTRYGTDLYGELSLLKLLKELVKVEGLEAIRLMYVYGDVFSDELIEFIANEKKMLPYIDIPIQHASNRVLKSMRRRDTQESLRELILKLRRNIPNLILRTTVLVGFPGESDEDFQDLLEFIKEMKFDRLGCFVFSPEEGTLAAKMVDQVDHDIAVQRYEEIMSVQKNISLEANQKRVGTECDILLSGISEDGLMFTGRSYGEAPDIDPEIFVLAQSDDLHIGDRVKCKIVDASAYELTAVTL